MSGVATYSIKILKEESTTGVGSFDYSEFDFRAFDGLQTYSHTIKRPVRSFNIPLFFEGLSAETYKVRRSPTSFKVARNNPTSLSIIMELVN